MLRIITRNKIWYLWVCLLWGTKNEFPFSFAKDDFFWKLEKCYYLIETLKKDKNGYFLRHISQKSHAKLKKNEQSVFNGPLMVSETILPPKF